ncbi:MAG TPA: transporter [Ramlibacter sp.]|nr:transporter [Ramlibacter sp.]
MKYFASLLLLMALAPAHAQRAGNFFGDPFVQVTSGLPDCPVPRGPFITDEQARVQQHVRSQHGTSCHRVGRCRLPNSYLYDQEIIPRVQLYIREDGRFKDTSLWVLGERRIVSIYGCVKSSEQASALERTVVLVDDVMNVVPFIMVGTEGKPPYHVVGDTTPD